MDDPTNVVDWLDVGFGATAILVSILIVLLGRRYSGRMAFAEGQRIYLFHDIVASLEKVNLQYNGEAVVGRLLLIRGYLINSGWTELTRELTLAPFQAKLPTGCVWHEFHLDIPARASAPQIKIAGPQVTLDGLEMLREECIGIHALIEVGPQTEPPEIEWSHRTRQFRKNVRAFDLTDDYFEGTISRRTKIFFSIGAIVLLFIASLTIHSALTSSSAAVAFEAPVGAGKKVEFALRASATGEVYAVDRRSSDRLDLDVQKLFGAGSATPIERFRWSSQIWNLSFLVFSIYGVWILLNRMFGLPGLERTKVRRIIEKHSP